MSTTPTNANHENSAAHPILSVLQSFKRLWEGFSSLLLENLTSFQDFASVSTSLSSFQNDTMNFSDLYPLVFDILLHDQSISSSLLNTLEDVKPKVLDGYVGHSTLLLQEKTSILMIIDPLLHKLQLVFADYEQEKSRYTRLCNEAKNAVDDLQEGAYRDPLVGYDVNYSEKLREKLKSIKKKLELAEISYYDASELARYTLIQTKDAAIAIIAHMKEINHANFENIFSNLFHTGASLSNFLSESANEILNMESLHQGASDEEHLIEVWLEEYHTWKSFARNLRISFESIDEPIEIGSPVEANLAAFRKDLSMWLDNTLRKLDAKKSVLKVFKIYMQEKKSRCEDLAKTMQMKNQEAASKGKGSYSGKLFDLIEAALKSASDKTATLGRFFAVKLLVLDNLRVEQKNYTEELSRNLARMRRDVYAGDTPSEAGSMNSMRDEWGPEEAQDITEKIVKCIREYNIHESSRIGTVRTLMESLFSAYKTFWTGLKYDFEILMKSVNKFREERGVESQEIDENQDLSAFVDSFQKGIEEIDEDSQDKQKIPWDKIFAANPSLAISIASPKRSMSQSPEKRRITTTQRDLNPRHRPNESVDFSQQESMTGRASMSQKEWLPGQDEEPIGDFTCCVQSKKPKKGRLYVFSEKVCFHSGKLLGDLFLTIPRQEIIGLEKKASSIIFDDSIVMHTRKGEIVFTSFLYRDKALRTLEDLIKGNLRGRTERGTHPAKEVTPRGEAKPVHKRIHSDVVSLGNSSFGKLKIEGKGLMRERTASIAEENPFGSYTDRYQNNENIGEEDSGQVSLVNSRNVTDEARNLESKGDSNNNIKSIPEIGGEKGTLIKLKKLNILKMNNFESAPNTFDQFHTREPSMIINQSPPINLRGNERDSINRDSNLEDRKFRILNKLALDKYEKEVHKECFDCNTKDLYTAWFSEENVVFHDKAYSNPWIAMMQEKGDMNVRKTPWSPEEPEVFGKSNRIIWKNFLEVPDFSKRSFKYTHQSDVKLPLAPKSCEMLTRQYIYWISPEELIIETETFMSNFPMSDTFVVKECYCIRDIDRNKCEFIWNIRVDFIRQVLFRDQLANAIENGVLEEAQKTLPLMKERLEDVLQSKPEMEKEERYSLHSAAGSLHSHNAEDEEQRRDTEVEHEVRDEINERFETFGAEEVAFTQSMINEEEEKENKILDKEKEPIKEKELEVVSLEKDVAEKVEEEKAPTVRKDKEQSVSEVKHEKKEDEIEKKLVAKSKENDEDKMEDGNIREDLKKVVTGLGEVQSRINQDMDFMKKAMIIFIGINLTIWMYFFFK